VYWFIDVTAYSSKDDPMRIMMHIFDEGPTRELFPVSEDQAWHTGANAAASGLS
jgi:hypothetical protein